VNAAPPSSQAAPPLASRHFILGTAGHIDHGKTSLVKALTGTDTDRLPEEKRRGMTIELGFAELAIGPLRFGVVDVPGHEKFVRTMVAGATGIDVALLVVAADDSVMPQTIEHVAILGLLGVPRMVVALTKVDMVEPDMAELAAAEVEDLLAATPFAASRVCPVSSITGHGLDDLREAIAAAAGAIAAPPRDRPFRMCVDRVFTLAGRGTVVTGSVLRGRVEAGETLDVFPGGFSCRVRDLQSHGIEQTIVAGGQRAAINLGGIDRDQVDRGSELATPGYLAPSRMLDVSLQALASADRPLKSTAVVHLCMGTTEAPVRVVLIDRPELAAGESAYAQLRCGRFLTAAYGQRFILRDASATRTLGGGVVLRPVARRRRWPVDRELAALGRVERGTPEDRLEDLLTLTGFQPPTDLQVCARAGIEPGDVAAVRQRLREADRLVSLPGGDAEVVPAVVETLLGRVTAWLATFHAKHPDAPGRPVEALLGHLERAAGRPAVRGLLDRWVASKRIGVLGNFVALPQFAPKLSAAEDKALAAMIEQIRAGGLKPPGLAELVLPAKIEAKRLDRLALLAVALGELVRIDSSIYLHADADRRLRETVAALIREQGPVSVSQAREALDSSRKFAVPFMEYLDRVGFTRRVGDKRELV
jgi:selenocysteine-specific elongation factor